MENRYTIGTELGRGTFGITYKGYDNILKKDVAIKIIDIEKSRKLGLNEDNIMEELEAMRILSGIQPSGMGCFPYIACYYDSGKILYNGRLSIMAVSEFVDGESLHSYINKLIDPVFPSELWTMMEQMISALRHIHSLGFAHRDIKPDNIMREKATGTLKIIDFGLACTTQCRSGPGTIIYMAPEIFSAVRPRGLPEAQAHDIWSMGLVFYQLANLHFPFDILDANGNYLRSRDTQNNIVNQKLYQSHYDNSNNDFFVSNDTFNYIIDSMLIREWTSRPTAQLLYEYIMNEDNGCIINGTKFNRRQLLNILNDNNIVISDPNAFLSDICSNYFR